MLSTNEQDLQQVTDEARMLVINFKHFGINLDHLFVAMLNTPCQAQHYLQALNVKECNQWLHDLHENTTAWKKNDEVRLTIHAERIIRHAWHIATLKNKQHMSSTDVLLAILSYNNHVSEKVKQAGIIFEDVAEGLPQTPLEIKLRQFRAPSRLAKFLHVGPSMKTRMEDIYEHATNLWSYQQYDDCITTCKTGLALTPTYDDLKIIEAHCYMKLRNYQPAVPLLKELSEAYPDNPDIWVTLSYIYDETGEYQQAEAILTRMQELRPDNSTILNNRAFNLYRQGRYAEAIPFYEKAISIDPQFAYPWDNLGFIKYKLGFTEEAFQLIDKALELDRGNSYAYMYKGKIHMEQGNKIQAMENFQLALRYGFTETYGDEVVQLIKQCQ